MAHGEPATGYLDEASAATLRAAGGDPGAGTVFRECAACPELVVQPGGDLALGRYEVTRGEYAAFVRATGHDGGECTWLAGEWRDPGFTQTDRHPVVCVSWNDAEAYAQWLTHTTGGGYRLPSEEEWERAAQGTPAGCQANGYDAYTCQRSDGADRTAPVGSRVANRMGLFDMVGNVWDWTEGCRENDCSRRAVRGGSWTNYEEDFQVGARAWLPAEHRDYYTGFRVARTLE